MKEKIDTNDNFIENKKKKKGKKKGHKIIVTILILILIAIITASSWFGYKVYTNGGGEFNLKGVLATMVGHDKKTIENLPKIYCLVTGQSQNLTDTIMLCSYDPKTQEASILSIPRDTFVGTNRYSANSYNKINALYQTSPQKTLDAVNKITGLNVQYYLNVDTEALKEIVDSIGGVYFDVPIDMDYDDPSQDLHIHLKAGYQLLDGNKAEQAVRFRHNNNGTSYPIEYGDNDLGRMKTQRAFIEAVIKKLATPSTLTKVPELIKVLEKNITTNLDISKAKDYAPYAVEFKTENLKTATLPGTPELFNSLWFFTPNKTEVKTVVEDLFGNQEEEDIQKANEENKNINSTNVSGNITSNKTTNNKVTNATNSNVLSNTTTSKVSKNSSISEDQKNKNNQIKIELLNGTSDNQKLNEVKTKLKELGYNVTKTGITSNTSKTTIINRTGKSSTIVNEIKNNLNNTGNSFSGSDNSNVDITIIIGNDYK